MVCVCASGILCTFSLVRLATIRWIGECEYATQSLSLSQTHSLTLCAHSLLNSAT